METHPYEPELSLSTAYGPGYNTDWHDGRRIEKTCDRGECKSKLAFKSSLQLTVLTPPRKAGGGGARRGHTPLPHFLMYFLYVAHCAHTAWAHVFQVHNVMIIVVAHSICVNHMWNRLGLIVHSAMTSEPKPCG